MHGAPRIGCQAFDFTTRRALASAPQSRDQMQSQRDRDRRGRERKQQHRDLGLGHAEYGPAWRGHLLTGSV